MNLTEPQIEAVFEWIDLNVDRKTAIRFVKDFYKPNDAPINFSDEFSEYIRKSRERISAQKAYQASKVRKISPMDNGGIQEMLQMKAMANLKNEVRERYPQGTKIKTPHGKIVEVIEIDQEPTNRFIYATCTDGNTIGDVLIYHQVNDLDIYWAEIVTDKPHEVNVPFCQTAKSKTIVDKTQGEFTSTNGMPEVRMTNDMYTHRLMELSIFVEGWTKEDVLNTLEYKKGVTVESYSYPGEQLIIRSETELNGDKLIAGFCVNKKRDYFYNVVLMERNFNGTGNTYWATIVK